MLIIFVFIFFLVLFEFLGLFAYGQTGSGKSYSMVGYGADRGIVPLAMEEMFARIEKNGDPNVKYLVEASMMEIYNEKVRDLFNPQNEKNNQGLKVRDHPQTGPYVEGLSHNVVTSYKDIQRLMDEGTAARTVAATQMNSNSSRAHTVFQIVFTTTVYDDITNKSTSKTSRINLVDLAGSERVRDRNQHTSHYTHGYSIYSIDILLTWLHCIHFCLILCLLSGCQDWRQR